ncbi:MAG: 2-succinyl-5-enolpyruvyl-6-hydroxy-3-cyclohexene-1-carboxylic-acid synthase [Bacteroidetes Order II. Incertae sedis bacterium]|nr:2-succinyl-5-enolpyruvyl-6-hydroxy-3-cyclohexene-1-carboxylic-acid synthase [Bacteroidetes Order II. bacterium]
MEYTLSTARLNQLWAELMVNELVGSGIDHFFVAPGSRSTPFAVAIARHPNAQKTVHPDERGTAFAALGFARATGKPAVWVTTSGTAVANGLPAVVEASNDRIPMLLLTADRPPELRETDANQTIRQIGIFGTFTRWAFDMPCPDAAIPAQMVLSTVRHAISQSIQEKGPVHLNCMFREPLVPQTASFDHASYLAPLADRTPMPALPISAKRPLDSMPFCDPAKKGLVILGQLGPHDIAVSTWLDRLSVLNWPILPDIGSQFRLAEHPHLIHYYDQLLLARSFSEAHKPEVILQIGSRFTSKRLQKWIETIRPQTYVVVKDHPHRSDPAHLVTQAVEADLNAFIHQLSTSCGQIPTSSPEWLNLWQAANQKVGTLLEQTLDDKPENLSEPLVARILSRLLPEGHTWFLGNSMPIRDADMYAAPAPASVAIGTNRGASGIDGLVASAIGFAIGRQQPLTLLIGDVSLLHDLNSLLMVRNSSVPITIVVINNDGGGIFSFLPISAEADVFEPYFGTPHGRSFSYAARFFDLPYASPQTTEAFESVYQNMTASGQSGLIEVVTDRQENVHYHKILQDKILAAIG